MSKVRLEAYHGRNVNTTRSEVLSYLSSGVTVREVATMLKCSYGTVLHICGVLGIRLQNPGRRRTPIPESELRRFSAPALSPSWDVLGKRFGCSASHIRNEFKRLKIAKRDARSKNAIELCQY